VLLVNWEFEHPNATADLVDPGITTQIVGSQAVYLYGFYGGAPVGTWPNPLLELSSNKQLRIWNVQEFNLPNILEDCTNQPCLELGTLGSQAGQPGEILGGYIAN
jgi:hypothetical protein